MSAYKLTVYATNERYSPWEDISEHYVIADFADAAIDHVKGHMEKAGWKINQIRDTAIVIETA